MLNQTAAELRKTFSLPSVYVGIALATVGTIGLSALAASTRRAAMDRGDTDAFRNSSPLDAGFEIVGPGVIGMAVLAVVIMSSEYTPNRKDAGAGRQILVSLTSVPRRGVLLTAKAVVVAVLTTLIAMVSILSGLAVTQAVLGEHGRSFGTVLDQSGWRIAGAIAYWVCSALIALAVTAVTRSGVIPLVVLIVNSSMVSVSYLLTKVTPLARYLPDVAGAQSFTRQYPADNMLGPATGALVMAGWTAVLLVAAGWIFARRDA
ncbi:hypothetical protein [Kribbella sp. CA-294648]|uniref:hypothetical protein n=1 Tax=Kribbella sp. CA-294648 TaxID=3239948 RepID=UPI003D8AC10E